MHDKQIVGTDTDKDGWTAELVVMVQPDGTLLVVSEHRYRTTVDGTFSITLALPETKEVL